jgi:hypothetical protein
VSKRQSDPSSVVTVRAVARTVVAALAPEELPDFEVRMTAYERSPSVLRKAVLRKAARRDDGPDGSGAGTAQPLTTGVIKAVDAALTKIAQATTDGAARRVRRPWRRRGTVAAVRVEALNNARLEQAREAALVAARRTGLRMKRAELIADATVGALIHVRRRSRS